MKLSLLRNLNLALFIIFFVFAFSSCSPKVTTTIKRSYSSLSEDSVVAHYKKPTSIPIDYEVLGKTTISCNKSLHKNCDSTSIYLLAETEVRKAGGNTLLTNKFQQPSWLNTGFELKADILKVFDFSSPLDSLYINPLKTPKKGTIDLRVSLPYINQFTLKPTGENTRHPAGFLGALFGVDYYHTDNQYLSLFLGVGMDYFIFVPVGVDIESGEWEFTNSVYLGLTNNHQFPRFALGYGLSFSIDDWSYRYYGEDEYFLEEPYNGVRPDNRKFLGKSVGLMFSTHYLFTKNFSIGVIYRPNIIQVYPKTEFRYGHLISVDFAWKIRLWTKK